MNEDDFSEKECNISNGKLSFKLPSNTDKLRKEKGRMTVKVLDAVECVHAGVDKFIPFARRLHSWTTIKVSSIQIRSILTKISKKSSRLICSLTWNSKQIGALIYKIKEKIV